MTIKNVICDIDGVLMHDNVAVPGAAEFLHRIIDKGMPLVLLTNYPSQTGQDLANRFATAGINVPDSVFYTSAMATADFLKRQEGKKAYVVGEGALIHELYKAGFTITDVNPDFVIVGETRSFNWEMMHKAAYFVASGARFIATNPDTHGRGFYPACGALCAGIEKISGRKPFVVGKPSPWIIRAALNTMQAHSEETVSVITCAPIFWPVSRRVWRPFWFSPVSLNLMTLIRCRFGRAGSTPPSTKLTLSNSEPRLRAWFFIYSPVQ